MVEFVLWSCGTLVHEVKQRLPANPRRAKIRNFFIKLLFDPSLFGPNKNCKPSIIGNGDLQLGLLLIVLRDARIGLGLVLRSASGRIGRQSPSTDFGIEHSVLCD